MGYEKGEHLAWYREWLYWNDKNGDRYLTASAKVKRAEAIAKQKQMARQQTEQKVKKLAKKLQSLGINPDEI